MTTDLRKYALEKALEIGGLDIKQTAQELYEWLVRDEAALPHIMIPSEVVSELNERRGKVVEQIAPMSVTPPLLPEVIKTQWQPGTLNAKQTAILSVLIGMQARGETINGVTVDAETKGTMGLAYLNKLKKLGYVECVKKGHWRVKYNANKQKIVRIEHCPPAAAKGYKPMTAKLGSVARIKS